MGDRDLQAAHISQLLDIARPDAGHPYSAIGIGLRLELDSRG
jgi:hypothetical protein